MLTLGRAATGSAVRLRSLLSRVARLGKPAKAAPCLPCAQSRTLRPFAPGPRSLDLLTPDTVPRLQPGVVYTVVDGSLVLYDVGRARSHVLNPAAASVWAEIDDASSVHEIVQTLAERSDVAPQSLELQVKEIIDQLVRGDIATVESISDDQPGPSQLNEAPWSEPTPPDLDALEWPAVVGPVRVLDAAVTVRTNAADLASPLREALAGFSPAEPGLDAGERVVLSILEDRNGTSPSYRLYAGGRRRWSDDGPGHALAALDVELTDVALGHSHGRVLLHAGAVERDGVVVVIGGDSGSGKSTLTAALTSAGWRYLTDEITAVTPNTMQVAPYPKAFDLDASAQRLVGLDPPTDTSPKTKTVVPVDRLGTISSGGTLSLVVLLTEQDSVPGGPLPTGTIRDAVDLIGITFAATLTEPGGLDHLVAVASRAQVVRVGRAPLHDLVARIEAFAAPGCQ